MLPTVTPTEVATPLAGCDLVRHEASKYDWDVTIITAIAQAESGCRPDARGDGHLTYEHEGRTYGYSVSVMQVRILQGRESCDSYDVSVNMQCAYRIWQGQGYHAWSMYNNGRYKAFM